jgi:ferric-dicitrate binding protein FerR (iron transport regulator)
MRGFGRLVMIWAIVAGSLLPLHQAWANVCTVDVGRFVSIDGSVDVQGASSNRWTSARLYQTLCQGDTIRVGERSRTAVALINDAVLRLDQNTTLRLLDIAGREQDRSFLDIVRGAFQSFSRKPKTLAVNTPYLNGSIEGTEFLVRVDDTATTITVFEGVVTAANDRGQVALQPGQAARAAAGEAPQTRILVRPRDEVQWAL